MIAQALKIRPEPASRNQRGGGRRAEGGKVDQMQSVSEMGGEGFSPEEPESRRAEETRGCGR